MSVSVCVMARSGAADTEASKCFPLVRGKGPKTGVQVHTVSCNPQGPEGKGVRSLNLAGGRVRVPALGLPDTLPRGVPLDRAPLTK